MSNQRSGKKTTETERAQITFFYGSGMSVRAISELTGLSTKCIYRWTKRFSSGEDYEPKKPNLQRSMFNDTLKARLKEYVLANRGQTLNEYIANLQLTCKASVLCKVLLKMGLGSYKAPPKDQISETHREIRLIKAQEWVI